MRGTAEELRKLRQECGLTVDRAAELTCTPKRTWQGWEQAPGTARASSPPGLVFAFLRQFKLLQEHDMEEYFDPQQVEEDFQERVGADEEGDASSSGNDDDHSDDCGEELGEPED